MKTWTAWLLVLMVPMVSMPAMALRVLVLPVGGDVDPMTSVTLGRAVETAVRDALPTAEVMTTASLQTSIEVSTLQDCTNDEAVGACVSEIADASNADVVIRPHLGRLGDEFLFTITITEGSSARLLTQTQRRTDARQPSDLLDVTPGLVRQSVVDAELSDGRMRRPVPVTPIAVAVGGVVAAGVGVGTLVLRDIAAKGYAAGEFDRGQAAAFETLGSPVLLIGGALVVVGSLVAVGGAGVAVWSVVGGE